MGGEVVSEVNPEGKKLLTFVRTPTGTKLAWQKVSYPNGNPSEAVSFEHWDASSMSFRTSDSQGYPYTIPGFEYSPAEFDPLGAVLYV